MRKHLIDVAFSPRETQTRSLRAKVLLAYAGGTQVCRVANYFQVSAHRVLRIIDEASGLGILASLEERRGRSHGTGRPPEAISWLLALAELPPTHFGYQEDNWSMPSLVAHARKFGPQAGHPTLADLTKASAYRYFAIQGRPFRREGMAAVLG